MNHTTLYEKLALVMKNCSYIAKTGENTFHGYSYVTSNDVLERINESFSTVGLITMVTPTLLDLREVQTAKGTIDKHATIGVSITILDVETGESIQISGIGSGQDSGDKAIMKAETAAIKYAYMLSFCIATGDDPESDSKTDERMHTTEQAKVTPVTTETTVQHKRTVNNSTAPYCTDCGITISAKVAQYSKSRYKVPLCMSCQKEHSQSA